MVIKGDTRSFETIAQIDFNSMVLGSCMSYSLNSSYPPYHEP